MSDNSYLGLPLSTLTNSERYETAILGALETEYRDHEPLVTTVRTSPASVLVPMTFEVFSDALKVGGYRISASALFIGKVRDTLNKLHSGSEPWQLMTAPVSDLTYLAASLKLTPRPGVNQATLAMMLAYSRLVDAEIDSQRLWCATVRQAVSGDLVADSGKDWVTVSSGSPATYGWHASPDTLSRLGIPGHSMADSSRLSMTPDTYQSVRVIQPLYQGHGMLHSDYSQTVRLWRSVNYC